LAFDEKGGSLILERLEGSKNWTRPF